METTKTLNRLHELQQKAEQATTPDEAMEYLVGLYKEAKSAVAVMSQPFEDMAKEAKVAITDIIIETKRDRWDTGMGKVYIPAPGIVATYDAKGIDALIREMPELAKLLLPFRSEKERAGSLTVR